MAGEVKQAMERMEARKIAAGVGPGLGQATQEETTRRIWSGLDIDIEEIHELQQLVASVALDAVLIGLPFPLVASGMYFGGIATGLLLAEARQREEARS